MKSGLCAFTYRGQVCAHERDRHERDERRRAWCVPCWGTDLDELAFHVFTCDQTGSYFVFHGTSRSKRPMDWVYPPPGEAKTTIVGHGERQADAYEDAKLHELERGPGGYEFSGVAHVSGPHRLKSLVPL